MDISELRNDIVVIEFFEMMQYSEATEKNYLMALKDYTHYMNMPPSDLIEEARHEIRSGRMLSERTVKRHVLGFRKWMADKGMAPLSIKMRMSCITTFYKFFDVEIPRLPRAKSKARTLEGNDNIPSIENIREVLKVASIRDRAILLVGISSGMGSSEVRRITIKQFRDGYDKETGIATIKMRRSKTDVDFITFLSPEASEAVLDYLKYRDRPCTSRFKHVREQQAKQRITHNEGFLFIKERIPVEYSSINDEHMRQMTAHAILMLYQRLSSKAGLDSPNSWNIIRSHNMRKLFCSSLYNNGADTSFVEQTMGHDLGDVKGAYFVPDPEKLKNIYIQYVHALRVMEAVDIESSEEYQRMKSENEMYAAAKGRDSLKVDMALNDVEQLKRDMESMRDLLKTVGLLEHVNQ